MKTSQLFSKSVSRRRFMHTLLSGAGVAATATALPLAAANANAFGGGTSSGRTTIDVWTGWTKRAAQSLAKLLEAQKSSPRAVKSHGALVPDGTVQNLLSNLAASQPQGTEYYVTVTRRDSQPTSDEEAALIVYTLSIWAINGATLAVEKVYSRSFRDATLVRSAISRGSEFLWDQRQSGRRYHKLVVAG